jgi:hypothetical protein
VFESVRRVFCNGKFVCFGTNTYEDRLCKKRTTGKFVEDLAQGQDSHRFPGVFFPAARAPGTASLEDSAGVKKGVGKFCRA